MSLDSFKWPDEFISLDGRNGKREPHQSYPISERFFALRHAATLTPDTVNNAKILDLGSYLGATGYWCASNGCASYTGIENISEYAQISRNLLSKYCPPKWSICEQEIQQYLTTTSDKFDIAVAWGVFNTFTDPILMLERLLCLANTVFIDSPIPNVIVNNNLDELSTAVIEINPWSSMAMDNFDNVKMFQGSRISIAAIELIAKRVGFSIVTDPYIQLQSAFPDIYGPGAECQRFMIKLVKSDEPRAATYRDIHG